MITLIFLFLRYDWLSILCVDINYKLFWDFNINAYVVGVKHKLKSFAETRVLLN